MTDDRRLRHNWVGAETLHQLLLGAGPGRLPIFTGLPSDCRILEVRWNEIRQAYRVLLWSSTFDVSGDLQELPYRQEFPINQKVG